MLSAAQKSVLSRVFAMVHEARFLRARRIGSCIEIADLDGSDAEYLLQSDFSELGPTIVRLAQPLERCTDGRVQRSQSREGPQRQSPAESLRARCGVRRQAVRAR